MTRTSSHRTPRPSKKSHYRPETVSIADILQIRANEAIPPRQMRVQSPWFEQMECGSKTVEARPNYPCLGDLTPGTVVEFLHCSGRSFLAKITSRRVHRDFATMLRKETIQACLPHHDPEDLQRAVNTYHSFRNETYKYIARKHGVLSLRFTHITPPPPKKHSKKHYKQIDWGEYDRNSLCSIFESVNAVRAKTIRKIFRRVK